MDMRREPEAVDLEAIRRWFAALADRVQAVDFTGAHPLFADDMIAFGTFTDFMTGRPDAEREQWRNVWPTIRDFRWRLDGVRAIISADRLTGIGMAVFDSTGFQPDGTRFERRGRATVTFARAAVGDPWVATHTHMSLFRGTPDRSHGKFTGRDG
ncbi:MAG: nuclear transport factor 2 family protein [Rhodospirillales bacterium]|nr:MAG: nuclear transport factor 2 family protein [Rhodospirillales bacterium]